MYMKNKISSYCFDIYPSKWNQSCKSGVPVMSFWKRKQGTSKCSVDRMEVTMIHFCPLFLLYLVRSIHKLFAQTNFQWYLKLDSVYGQIDCIELLLLIFEKKIIYSWSSKTSLLKLSSPSFLSSCEFSHPQLHPIWHTGIRQNEKREDWTIFKYRNHVWSRVWLPLNLATRVP